MVAYVGAKELHDVHAGSSPDGHAGVCIPIVSISLASRHSAGTDLLQPVGSALAAAINAMAADGWRMVFMEKVQQRYMLTSDRETLMVTFERRVPEAEREARAARCIDDVIAAEDGARRIGRRAGAGALAAVLVGAVATGLASNSDEA